MNSGVDNQIVDNRIADNQIIIEEEGNEEHAKNLRINIKAPTLIEIKKALKELQKGKTAGIDNIPPEVLKVDLDITANTLHPYSRGSGMKMKCPMIGNVVH